MVRVSELLAAFKRAGREPEPGDVLRIRDRWRWCEEHGRDPECLEAVLWDAIREGLVALAPQQPPLPIRLVGPTLVLTEQGAVLARQIVTPAPPWIRPD